MSILASLRRILAVARTTARDLGAECVGVLLVLAGGLWLFAPGGQSVEEALAGDLGLGAIRSSPGVDGWTLLQTLQHWVAGACVAVVILTAWSVDRDRRHGRWQWWWTTPLRCTEYVAGKWLALWSGSLALTLLLAALGLALDAPARSDAILRPARRQVADAVSPFVKGGAPQLQAPRPVLLGTTDARVLLEFRTLPEGGSPVMEVKLQPWNYELRDDRGLPELRVVDGRGEVLAERSIPGVRGPLRVPLHGAVAPLRVAIKPGSFQRVMPTQPGGLRVDPRDVVLLGGPTPVVWTLGHLAGAWALLLAWSCALVVLCSTLLADLLAATAAGTMLALAFGRAFLLDVTQSITDPQGPASALARGLARASAAPLRWLPDFEDWLDLRSRAAGMPVSAPWELPFVEAGLGVAVGLGAASLVLTLRRRGR